MAALAELVWAHAENKVRWQTYLIGVAVVAVGVTVAAVILRRPPVPSGRRDDGYGAQISIDNAQVSAAQSMMGGGLVYYDGTLTNHGDQTLTGFTVELTFNDIAGRPIERDRRVLLDDQFRPVAPHSQRSFEIGFDQVPAGWNQAPPTPRAVAVYVR